MRDKNWNLFRFFAIASQNLVVGKVTHFQCLEFWSCKSYAQGIITVALGVFIANGTTAIFELGSN